MLLINQQFGVADDVDKEHIGDLQLDFLLNFGGHAGDCRGLGAKPLPHSVAPDQLAKAIERGGAFTDTDRANNDAADLLQRSTQIPADSQTDLFFELQLPFC